MSMNGCEKLFCSPGNANFDRQTEGTACLNERQIVSVLTAGLVRSRDDTVGVM